LVRPATGKTSQWLDIVPIGPKPMNLGILWFYLRPAKTRARPSAAALRFSDPASLAIPGHWKSLFLQLCPPTAMNAWSQFLTPEAVTQEVIAGCIADIPAHLLDLGVGTGHLLAAVTFALAQSAPIGRGYRCG